MRAALLLALIGCYTPHPQTGSPCDQGPCPAPLVCSPATLTCEVTAIDAATSTDVLDTQVLIDGCTPTAEICGDGIDQDCDGIDPACVANDAPGGAIDISAGGTFSDDLRYARDDAAQADCGGDGGRDVFYKIVLAGPEVVYLDTFGSSFGTIVRVFPGKACTDLTIAPACNRNACGGAQSQIAGTLPAGTSCIVIDQHAADTSGMLTMHVTRGGRDGSPLGPNMQTYTATSCTGKNNSSPGIACAGNDTATAEDAGYYFTVCPSQTLTLDASTSVDATVTAFDTVMYVRRVGNANNLACNDDTSTCMARPARPANPDGSTFANVALGVTGLYWLTVDGYSGACGTYRLDTNLR